jgi:hypothetical protein
VGAVPGQELVPELLARRHLVRQQLGREQPVEEVVVPEVAVAPGEAEHAGYNVCLEHGAHEILRHPEPVLRRPVPGLEVACGQHTFRADPLEHPLGHLAVLIEDLPVEPGTLAAVALTEPGKLARRDERQSVLDRLEDVTAFVELVAPRGLVAGDARVQHEVVVAARYRDRVELDRAERPEHLDHSVKASRNRPRGCKEVSRDEEATCGLSGDLHFQDTNPLRGTDCLSGWCRR